jgi:predicted acylesterase/phospholipase RssA
VVAGTSTGAIIAGLMLKGKSASEIEELYKQLRIHALPSVEFFLIVLLTLQRLIKRITESYLKRL